MPILITLLPILLPLILECINKEGTEKTIVNLKRAGPLVQFRIYRAARKDGQSRPDARETAREAAEDLKDMTDDEIKFLLEEATHNGQ